MAAKLAFSKIKGRPASSAPLSFRFLPSEDDLEEVTAEEQDVEKQDETASVFRPSNTYPTSLEKVATEVSSIPHSLSTDSNDIFKENLSDISSPQNDAVEGLIFASGYVEQNKYSSSLPSEPSKQPSESTHNVRVKDARDSSPMKESVKDYLAKLGKRSSSLENSPATENDNWSLFNELKGRITKTFEEKISREPSISSKSVEKSNIQPSSQKSTQPSSPDETISSDKEEFMNYYDNSVSSPGSAVSERKFASADSTDSDRKSMSSEDQLPLFIENDNKSTNSLDDDIEDNSDMVRCIIVASNSGQKKTTSTIVSGAQALISPKRGRPSMSVTLSSLMAAKVLDSDSMEETPSELDTPDAESLETSKEKPLTKQTLPQALDLTENAEVETTKLSKADSPNDNVIKTLSRNKLLNEVQQACKNFQDCWQKQMLALIVIFVGCLVVPIPSFLSGFLSGVLLSAIIGWVLWRLFQPIATKEPVCIPDYSNLPPLVIPKSGEQSTDIYKGWMNELPYEYNPETYHVSNTQSVYIRLDGTSLRLSHPKSNIPKRAMWNEPRHEPVFIQQRYYDLAGAIISLLPEGLARKRLWSKKYPIYVEVADSTSQFQGEIDSLKGSSQRNSFGSTSSLLDSPDSDDKEATLKQPTFITSKLYLFARTSRDKEEWYWLLQQATKQKTNWLKSSLSGSNQSSQLQPTLKDQRSFSMDLGSLNTSSYGGGSVLIESLSKETSEINKLDFNQYISPFLDNEMWLKNFSNFPPLKDKKISSELKNNKAISSKECMLWLNALIGRIFFNFLTEEYWYDEVTERIQKKLSKIRVPYFIQELKLTDINLGKALPQIQRTSDPTMDNRGLWIDLDISYNGSFQMTLETKLNLLRLKRGQGVEMDDMSGIMGEKSFVDRSSRSYVQNSEEEDSAESSSDDDIYSSEMAEHGSLIKAPVTQHITTSGGSTSKKLLRFVDKIAQSRYFQQAAENRYIKKYMEDVSNTPLLLTVEVNGLIGTVAVNIPPPPTDRLWYGFRKNPQLSISARPKLGERQVTLAPVTDWIEKKLALEFQKILVMPNMDDLIIPIMSANIPSPRS